MTLTRLSWSLNGECGAISIGSGDGNLPVLVSALLDKGAVWVQIERGTESWIKSGAGAA